MNQNTLNNPFAVATDVGLSRLIGAMERPAVIACIIPAGVPQAVADEEFALIDTEGWHHIEGQYFASLSDAAVQRRRVAERRVRDAERRAAWDARTMQAVA